MNKKIEIIDILKGVAILLVILAHSIITFPIDIVNNVKWANMLSYAITRLHMPMFFIISGYLCSFKGNYLEYILKRVKRILVPYLVFNLAISLCRMLFTNFTNRRVTDLKDLLLKILLHSDSSAGYWFLYTMFMIALISPILKILLGKKYGNYYLLLIALSCFVTSCLFTVPEILSINNLLFFMPFYIFGMILSGKGFSFDNYKIKPLVIVLGIMIYAIGFGVGYYTDFNDILCDYLQCFSGCVLIAILFAKISMAKFIKNRLLISGKYSLQYYLINAFIITGSRMFLVNVLNITNPIVIVLGIFIITYTVSELVSKYVIDTNKLFRTICGM